MTFISMKSLFLPRSFSFSVNPHSLGATCGSVEPESGLGHVRKPLPLASLLSDAF